jgi:hypothetical protein
VFLYGHGLVDGDGGDIEIGHLLQPILPQCRVVAAVMADLVKNSAPEEIGAGDGPAIDGPGKILPGLPIADLGVRDEQQNIAASQLDGQH